MSSETTQPPMVHPEPVYQPDEDTISLLDLVAVLVRRKWLIAGMTMLAAVGVVVYSIISLVLPPERSPLPNLYTPSARVLINEDNQTSLSSVLGSSGSALAGLAGLPTGGGSSNGALALTLLQSRPVLDQIVAEFDIIERYEIEESPVAASRDVVREMASFELDDETGVLSIAVEHRDAPFATQIANRFVELLNQRFQLLGIDQTQSRATLLEQKIAEVDAEIARLENEIESFQRQYGAFNVQSLIEEQVAMRGRIRSDLIIKEIEISTYQEFSTVNDPVVQRLRSERDNLRQLLQEMDQGYSEFTSGLPSQQELPELATQFARLQREASVQAQIYTTLVQQYELAQLSLDGDERTFQVLEYAEVPDRKSGPSRGMISIITTITAFFLAVFLAFVLEYLARVKDDPEESVKLAEIRDGLRLFRRRR